MSTKIKGWYYDKQLSSPLTSATLHANKWWDGDDNGNGKFINWNQIKDKNGFGDHGRQCDDDKFLRLQDGNDQEGTPGCGYGIDPICTSIINEDFSIAISNTWSEFGGDPIGEAWNSLRGPMSAVAKTSIEAVNTILENNRQVKAAGGEHSKVSQMMIDALDWVYDRRTDVLSKYKDMDIVSFLNKAIVTQGTRFSYYGGTGVAFGNLGMKFTLFPKWDDNGNFLEVQKQVVKLYPYFIGQMEDFKSVTGIGNGTLAGDIANKCFMFQRPPGGYLTEMFDVDKTQEGTLKLKIGNFYSISNLVCSDVMLNFSKNMVKNPIDLTVSPLFCDVSITLRPSTKYTDRKLREFVGGMTNARRALLSTMKQNIDNEKQKLRQTVENQTYIIDQDV